MPHLSHQSDFDHPNNIWQGVQILNLLVLQLCPASCYLFCSCVQPPVTSYLVASTASVLPLMYDTKFYTKFKRTGRIIVVDFEDWTCNAWQSLALHRTINCICNLHTASFYSHFFLKYLMRTEYLISSWSVIWKSTLMIPSSFAYVWS